MYFNNTQRTQWAPMRWNTTGWVQPLNGFRNADVYNLALHEFGHWQFLGDNPPNQATSVMNFQEIAKPNLTDDDKHGATMLYGPFTSFENDQARWRGTNNFGFVHEANTSDSQILPVGVDNINGTGYLLYPRSGSGQLRILGTANAGLSHAYHKLFSYEDDNNPDIVQNRSYITITNGMFLSWCQANMFQRTMLIDFYMDNDVYFRDALRPSNGDLFRDTTGVPVHPALRGSYPTEQWICHQVDLSEIAGRKILRWMIAYARSLCGKVVLAACGW